VENLTLTGIRSPDVQPVASRYTDCTKMSFIRCLKVLHNRAGPHMTIRHMRNACWITKAKYTHSLPPIAVAKNECTCTSPPHYVFMRRYSSMMATLCWRNRIFWYVALRRWVNGTGRFDRSRWLQFKGSRGPLKFLDGPLDQSGRRHYIPSKCRELFTQWRCVTSQERRLVKTQRLATLLANSRRHKSWGRRCWRRGQLI
jgi:hypothetical protein